MEKKKYIKPESELIIVHIRQFMALSAGWAIDGGSVIHIEEDDTPDGEFLDLD